jgi:hypothetical protein
VAVRARRVALSDRLILPVFDDISDADQQRVAESLTRAIAAEDRRFFP